MIDKNLHYTLSLANDKIWNIAELVKFLVKNQGKSIRLKVNPEAHCLRSCGLYDILECFQFESVTIYTFNVLEKHPDYNVIKLPVDAFFRDYTKYDLSSSGIWTRRKIFGAFYGRPTANRLGILGYLHSKHLDLSEMLLAADIKNIDDRALFELDKLFEYDIHSISCISNMFENFNLGSIDYTPRGDLFTYKTPLNDLYKNILVDIVSEPNIKGTTFFPTEKIVRPMLMKKPFIAMTSKNYLDYLHQMGFYTFNEFWDESYDGYEGSDRYLRILSLIDWLASKPIAELENMFNSMKFQVEHNYQLIVNKKYSSKITLIEL